MRRWFDRLWLRLRSIMRGRAVDLALQRELRTHLEEQIAENLAAGMSAEEARGAALRAFGPLAQIEEKCRAMRRVSLVENLGRDLRFTLRSLGRQPLLALAASASIATAVAANGTIFNLTNQLLLSAPAARRADRLVYIRMSSGSHVSYQQWKALNESGALAGVAGYQIEIEVNWRGPEQSVSLMPLAVTANFFDLLGVPVAIGRGFTEAEAAAERNPNVVVISHRFWQRRLGAEANVLGRTLDFNGQSYTVVGVLPPGLRAVPGYGISPEVYLPVSQHLMPSLNDPNGAAVMLVGRLLDGQTLSEARAAFASAAQRLDQRRGDRRVGTVDHFAQAGGMNQLADFNGIGAFFTVLMVAVGLVLAIACANVAGLLLARSTVRRREIAVRVALGASRGRLVQQLLMEGLWLALIGTILGLSLSLLFVDMVSRIALPVPLPIELHATFDGRLLVYAVGLLALTTVLSGLVPALQATKPSLVPALKQEEPRYAYRRWTLRSVLVIGQVAVALVLLVTALVFVRNLARAGQVDPGFDTQRTLVAQVSFVEGRHTRDARAALLDAAVARLRALPGIETATYSSGVPLTMRSGMRTGADLSIAETGQAFYAEYAVNFVGPEYFSAMGIRLLRGREFRLTDRMGAPAAAIINELFAQRHFGGTDPVGHHLLLPGARTPYPAEIVGIVSNAKYRSVGEDQQLAVYEPFLQRGNRGRFAHVLVRAADRPEALARDVQQILTGLDPSAAVEVQPMRSALAFAFLPSRIGAGLLGTLGALGLALAMVGLFAVVSYAVSRRTAEIGIRMALGASRGAILRMVLGDAALVAATGIVIGLVIGGLATRPLAMFLVSGLSATDPIAFVSTAGLLGIASLTAALAPACRAMRIDPVTALRAE
jgi:putative ABC transport system permease protein